MSYNKNKNIEKFKVIDIHTDGKFGNDIDIITNNKQKYQIAVEKDIDLSKDLIGKYIELRHTKENGKYYFKRIDYKIG